MPKIIAALNDLPGLPRLYDQTESRRFFRWGISKWHRKKHEIDCIVLDGREMRTADMLLNYARKHTRRGQKGDDIRRRTATLRSKRRSELEGAIAAPLEDTERHRKKVSHTTSMKSPNLGNVSNETAGSDDSVCSTKSPTAP
jgi:hypothetical protein